MDHAKPTESPLRSWLSGHAIAGRYQTLRLGIYGVACVASVFAMGCGDGGSDDASESSGTSLTGTENSAAEVSRVGGNEGASEPARLPPGGMELPVDLEVNFSDSEPKSGPESEGSVFVLPQ